MLLSTAPLLQPLHNRTHQWDCVVPLVVSFVLRIKGTEPCMSGPVCAPVTPPTHTESLLPRHGWCFTFLALHRVHYCSTSPDAHLRLLGYIFVPLLPISSYRAQAHKCLYFAWFVPCCLPSFRSSTHSAEQGSVRICWVNLLPEPASDQLPQTENIALLEARLTQQPGC